jgi:hypothetical protein
MAAEPQPKEFNHGWTQMNADMDRTEKMELEDTGIFGRGKILANMSDFDG